MKKLAIAFLISLPCFPMQNLVDETKEQEILSQQFIDKCGKLPVDLSKKLAQEVLHGHLIISYLLRNVPIPHWSNSLTDNKRSISRLLSSLGQRTAKIWDSTDLQASETFLFRTISLTQAIILNAIYEVIIARRLIILHGVNANNINNAPSLYLTKILPNFLLKLLPIEAADLINGIILDFNRYPHLQEHYDKIPAPLRKQLDSFVTPGYSLQNQIDKAFVQQVLAQETTDLCDTLPAALSRKLAQEVLHIHPIIPYLLRNLAVPCSLTLKGHEASVNSVAFNTAGDRVITASDDGTTKIWDANVGSCLTTLTGHLRDVNSARFNRMEDMIVTASWDKTAKIWDIKTGSCLATLADHEDAVLSSVFNESGNQIATASFDGTAKIWSVETGECLVTLKGHTSVVNSAVFNNTGNRILTTSRDNTTKIWNVETGECLTTLESHLDWVKSATFNKTADRIVKGSRDGTAKIWNVETGDYLHTLKGHAGNIKSAVFNKDGDKIVTGSEDTTAKIWDLSDLHKLEQFLFKSISLKQAIILNAIYEVIIAQRLVRVHGKYSFTQHNMPMGLLETFSYFWKKVARTQIHIDRITLDFNNYPHLQAPYDTIPSMLRKKLDHFVTKQKT